MPNSMNGELRSVHRSLSRLEPPSAATISALLLDDCVGVEAVSQCQDHRNEDTLASFHGDAPSFPIPHTHEQGQQSQPRRQRGLTH